jgi:hypothetical protein
MSAQIQNRSSSSHHELHRSPFAPKEGRRRARAREYSVCTATVYKWAGAGTIPHVRIVNVVLSLAKTLSRRLNLRNARSDADLRLRPMTIMWRVPRI